MVSTQYYKLSVPTDAYKKCKKFMRLIKNGDFEFDIEHDDQTGITTFEFESWEYLGEEAFELYTDVLDQHQITWKYRQWNNFNDHVEQLTSKTRSECHEK